MTKEMAIETVNSMPHDFTVGELAERLTLIEKIEEAERDIAEGNIITHADAKRLFDEWMK